MTISEINANEPVKQDSKNINEIPISLYFGVFFDGTSNNMIQAGAAKELRSKYSKNRNLYETDSSMRPEEVNIVKQNENRERTKYSNIAILHSYYVGVDDAEVKEREKKSEKVKVYKIYVEGAGTNDINSIWNGKPIVGLGFGLGKTGVTALVSKAVRAIKVILDGYTDNKVQTSLKFDVFGFSRGAACARLFSYLIARNTNEKLPSGREKEFGKYFAKEYYNKENGRLDFINKEEWKEVSIDFLGIYDTVVSIGFLRRKVENNGKFEDDINSLSAAFTFDEEFSENFHDLNVTEYGQYSPQMEDTVKNCLHIGAMDEFRENFAFTDIGKIVSKNCLEVLIPGCHSDIGGGYVDGNDSTVDFHDYKRLLYYTSNPQNKEVAETEPLSKQLLVKLGWGEEKDVKDTLLGHLRIKRHVPKNYCSVPLRLMVGRTLEDVQGRGKNGMFNLPDDIYEIPKGLKTFKKNVENQMKGAKGKRLCIFPNGGYSGKNYQTLRLNYLHFTSSDTFCVKLANGANFVGNAVCRIVYHGDPGDKDMHYMPDFMLTAIEDGDIGQN